MGVAGEDGQLVAGGFSLCSLGRKSTCGRLPKLKGIFGHQRPVGVVRNVGGKSLGAEWIVDRRLEVYGAVLLCVDRVDRKAAVASANIDAIAAAEHAGVVAAIGIHRRYMNWPVLIGIFGRIIPACGFRAA